MKNFKKGISILLSLALILGCVFTALPVLAEDTTAEAEIKTAYSAYNDFSTENGNPNGVWSYQYRYVNDPDTYLDMTAGETGWSADGVGAIKLATGNLVTSTTNATMSIVAHGEKADAVLTFTAPYSGVINVSMDDGAIYAPHNSTDGVRFEMLHNGNIVDSCYNLDNGVRDGNKYFADTKALVVEKGDTIRFVVGRNKPINGMTYCCPTITYAKTYTDTTFNAVDDYTLDSNPNGVWTYQERRSATGSWVTLETNTGKTMWGDGSTEGGYISLVDTDKVTNNPALKLSSNGSPWAVSVLFTAPYSGTINVKMANGGVYAPETATGYNMTFDMTHNDASVVSNDALFWSVRNVFTDTKTITVKKGDTLRFIVGKKENSGTTFTIYMNPDITYTEITTDTFNAYDDYATTNNPNGVWSYQYSNNNSAFANMTASGETWYASTSASYSNINTIASDPGKAKPALKVTPHGSPYRAAVVFTAPYSGTINVTTVNGINACQTATNCYMTFELTHNDSTITSNSEIYWQTSYTINETLTVKAGDVIRFIGGRATDTATSYNLYFNPQISYTSIDQPETTGMSYYVSSSEGNNGYTGNNPYAAWKDLDKLSGLELKAGDKVYLKAGDTWSPYEITNADGSVTEVKNTLELSNVNGTEDNPVVITSYGDGAQPKIDLQLVEDTTTKTTELAVPAILLTNAAGVEIDNLAVTGTGVGIDLHYENDYNNEYVKVKNCTFTDITGFHQSDNRAKSPADRYYIASAIAVTVSNHTWAVSDPAIVGLYIDNCTSNNCGSLLGPGGSVYATNEGGSISAHGLYITDCIATGNDYYGIYVSGYKGGYIDGCTITGCGDAESFSPGTAGILLSATDFAVINTKISGQKRGGVAYDGVAIDLERNNDNVLIKNNYFSNNTGAGFLIYNATEEYTGTNYNVTITENIFEENAKESTGGYKDAIVDIRILSGNGCALSGSTISNNVWYNDNENYTFYQDYQTTEPETANVIENNNYSEDYEYQPSSDLSAEVAEMYDGYNQSTNTADVRKGYSEVSGELVTTDSYKHSEFTADSAEWLHQYYLDGVWNDMTYNSDSNSYTFGTGGSLSTEKLYPAARGLAAIIYVAPKAGRVKISMEMVLQWAQANAQFDGTYVTIANENRELLCDPIRLNAANSAVDFTPFYYNVAEGEKLYFMVSKCESNAADGTQITPVVEYVSSFGSVNEDAAIDVLDFIRMKKHLSDSTVTVSDYADIDGDGSVAAADTILLKKYLLGIYA